MKRIIRHTVRGVAATAVAAMVGIFLVGCISLDAERQYEDSLRTLQVQAIYPEGYEEYARSGVEIKVVDDVFGRTYRAVTDDDASAIFLLSEGFYNVSISDIQGRHIFNGASDQVQVAGGNVNLALQLVESHSSDILITEIYCGGCTKYPEEGTYASDKYIILHNNSTETYYLDGLCIGTLDPYNAQASNVWIGRDSVTGESVFPDFLPIAECIWQFGGGGEEFPLAPGEDAVVAINGAIDHTAQYPNSVNLNDEHYFVCYNPIYYPNTLYHPAPGDKIQPSHFLNVVCKLGPANAYPLSQVSPTVVIFRAKDCDMAEFIQRDDIIADKPGSSTIRVAKIPCSWAVDAVEVYDGTSSSNRKRLPPSIDAGYVYQSGTYLGRSLRRRLDEAASAEAGFEVYADTNNSTGDFYECERASLKDKETK